MENMTDNQRAWLKELYDREIEEERGTVDNEMTWAEGSPDATAHAMHRANADEHAGYIRVLERLRDSL